MFCGCPVRGEQNGIQSTAHLSPDFSGGLLRGYLHSTFCAVFCQLIHTHPDRLLQDEAELPKLPPLFFSAAGGVNSGGVDAAVAEDIREAHNVLETLIVRPGEEVAQIVGKDLLFEYPCRLRQPLQHLPDIGAVKRPSRPGDEYTALAYAALTAPGAEFFTQRVGNQDRAELALVVYACFSGGEALHGDRLQFADPQAEGAQRLDDQGQASVALL